MTPIDPLDAFQYAYRTARAKLWEVRINAAAALRPLGTHVSHDVTVEFLAHLIDAPMDFRTGLVFDGPTALGLAQLVRDDRDDRAEHDQHVHDGHFHHAGCPFCDLAEVECEALSKLYALEA